MDINQFLAKDITNLNVCIAEQLHSEVVLIEQVAHYIVNAGGKRMRPLMLLLAAHALNAEKDPRMVELAAVIEFIHTATLLHDDVVDESDQRRGQSTANALFGNAASVLVGDFLYSRAFQMMVKTKHPRVMEVLADATNVIAEGEVLQLMHIGDTHLSQAQYLKVIEYKTAKLFEAAARLPAVLLDDAVAEAALASFGRKIGAAFQIVDDVLDYEGDPAQMGKNLGDDLREGKVTLPIIIALSRSSTEQQARIRSLIETIQHTKDTVQTHESGAYLLEVKQLIETTQANVFARAAANDLLLEAVKDRKSVV